MSGLETIRRGAAFGKLVGRVTVVILALYLVSIVYRSNSELSAFALGGLIIVYAISSLTRDLRYGYRPWEPIEWTTVPPEELDRTERSRAIRWTIGLKLLQVIGAVSAVTIVFSTGLETLGYVLLLGGLPALIVLAYKHMSNQTLPWYPSVPSRIDQFEPDE